MDAPRRYGPDLLELISGVSRCEDVTDAHLASITTYSHSGSVTSIGSDPTVLKELQRGDFDGLTSLTRLNLRHHSIGPLPDGIFDDLTRLEHLTMTSAGIRSLPSGVFDENTNLRTLTLTSNTIGSLPSGVFDELTELRDLDVSSNWIGSLPSGILDNNDKLVIVDFDNNRIPSLPDAIFANQAELKEVQFHSNHLTSIPAGIFAGNSKLTKIDLANNRISSLPAGMFRGLHEPLRVYLQNNNISELPDGLFASLSKMRRLRLDGNPGADFPITIEPEVVGTSTDSDGGRISRIRFKVDKGAPFQIEADLSVAGGYTTNSKIAVLQGGTRDKAIPRIVKQRSPDVPASLTVSNIRMSRDSDPVRPWDARGIRLEADSLTLSEDYTPQPIPQPTPNPGQGNDDDPDSTRSGATALRSITLDFIPILRGGGALTPADGDRVDYRSFTIDTRRGLVAGVISKQHPEAHIEDANGNTLATFSSSESATTQLDPGTYYVRVEADGEGRNFYSLYMPLNVTPLPAITNPTATPTHNSVALTWDYSTYGSFWVERRSPGEADWVTLTTKTPDNRRSYRDRGLAGGATYHYRVTPWNGVEAGPETIIEVTTPLPIAPPAPSGLEATATHNSAALSWTAPSTGWVTGYRVLRQGPPRPNCRPWPTPLAPPTPTAQWSRIPSTSMRSRPSTRPGSAPAPAQ